MHAQLLDGKLTAQHWQSQLGQQIDEFYQSTERYPSLAVVVVGDDVASQIYVKRKQDTCAALNIHSIRYQFDATVTTTALLACITQLNQRTDIDGILVQLPLPQSIDQQQIIGAIASHKDVDGFHPENLGRLAQGQPTLRPCTPLGILYLLQHYQITLRGKKAVVVGASNIVGRPLAFELINAGCTVTICHSKTRNLAAEVSQAELLISAIGKRAVIDSDWLQSSCIVVDVGIHRVAGKIVGDLDFARARLRASWLTPVPGGVGPMTVAALMHNTLQAARRNCR